MATPLTIAQAAYDAGLRSPIALAQAVAVALAESGGNERAHNRVPPDDSYGLWQINMYGSLGPARREQFKITADSELFNIATNAAAMASISGTGSNWKPWSTFGGPAYTLLYPVGAAAATAVLAARGAGATAEAAAKPITDVVEAAGAAVGFAQKASAWLSNRNNWVRIAKVVVGGAMLVGGVLMITKPYTDSVVTNVIKPIKGIL